jgi:hypothetical protein
VKPETVDGSPRRVIFSFTVFGSAWNWQQGNVKIHHNSQQFRAGPNGSQQCDH